MTFGASLGLTVSGAAVAGAGGATTLGSFITKKVVEGKKRDTLKELGQKEQAVCEQLDNDFKLLMEVSAKEKKTP